MKPEKMGIRIDSGDVSYLTKKARAMLDAEGLQDCSIVISNSLDEYIIQDILLEGACIDSFGVGERMITAKSDPVFGGVYKLAALEKNGVIIPKMKISENIEKITNPGFKSLYRLFDKDTHHAIADVITLNDEAAPEGDAYEIFDPQAVWKRKKLNNFYAKNLRRQIFRHGELVYDMPSLEEIKDYCAGQIAGMWEEMRRFENPQTYYVDLSPKLWDLKNQLLHDHNAEE
jgi:Nicotinic acid phosphoribosyltransferase